MPAQGLSPGPLTPWHVAIPNLSHTAAAWFSVLFLRSCKTIIITASILLCSRMEGRGQVFRCGEESARVGGPFLEPWEQSRFGHTASPLAGSLLKATWSAGVCA